MPSGYGQPGALPPGYYAGPDDPLVSANFAGWWARSFHLLRQAWRPVALVQLLSVVPAFAISAVMNVAVADDMARLGTTTDPAAFDFEALFRPLVTAMPFLLVAGVIAMVTQLASLRLLVQVATGRPAAVGPALLDGLRRLPAMLGWGILAGLAVVVGILFCVLPGLYVMAVSLILPAVVLLERGDGLGRAFQLFHADFGAALGRAATTLGLLLGVNLLGSAFAGVLAPNGTTNATLIVAGELLAAAVALAGTLVAIPMTLTAYADMRARREPFSTAYLIPAP